MAVDAEFTRLLLEKTDGDDLRSVRGWIAVLASPSEERLGPSNSIDPSLAHKPAHWTTVDRCILVLLSQVMEQAPRVATGVYRVAIRK